MVPPAVQHSLSAGTEDSALIDLVKMWFKVRGERYKRVQRGNFFTQRVVSVWNELPEVVVEVSTIFSFNKHLDSYIGKLGIEGYGPNVGNWD